MRFLHTITTAATGLRTNKSRSALTILGIVIGITAIILVMSVSRGAQMLILNEIQELGSATLHVSPGKDVEGPSDILKTFTESLTQEDLVALKNPANVPTLDLIVPSVFIPGSVSAGGETYEPQVFGTAPEMWELLDLELSDGAFFTEDDVARNENVALIGKTVKDELFGGSDAVGEKIKIKGQNFQVVGVLAQRGSSIFFNVDELVMVPHTTAQKNLLGIRHFNEFNIRAVSEAAVGRTAHDIAATLRESHGITDPDNDDFTINTQKDLAARISSITTIMAALLISVAAISLVVGGVGIMNIMLVSVTERTREVGLRKAIGATSGDILNQFLLEAIMLTVIGGAIGIAMGGLLSYGVSVVLSRVLHIAWVFTLPFLSIILGVGVSAVIGVIFGLYPARQAAKKSPIEALRYE